MNEIKHPHTPNIPLNARLTPSLHHLTHPPNTLSPSLVTIEDHAKDWSVYQGVVSLWDSTGPENATTVVWPGSHHHVYPTLIRHAGPLIDNHYVPLEAMHYTPQGYCCFRFSRFFL